MEVIVDDRTEAGLPLNVTWLSDDVALKPKPRIWTVVPTSALDGVSKKIPIWLPPVPVEEKRSMDSRFPTAS